MAQHVKLAVLSNEVAVDTEFLKYDQATNRWAPIPEPLRPVTLGAPVATAADLPAAGKVGEGRIAQDTGHLYQWNGSTWADIGPIKGPKGDAGEGVSDESVAGIIATGSETTAALAPVIDARTRNGNRPVGRGEQGVDVRDHGAKGDGVTDDSAAFQAAVNAVQAAGGGRILIVDTGQPYIFRATANPTIYAPKRTLITGNNVQIVGVGRPTIKMTGVTRAYLETINDLSSSGRDVFTVFAFHRNRGGSVTGIRFEGEWDGLGEFRYASPRAKGIGFIGVDDGRVTDCDGTGILGNLVNATPSDTTIDGTYKPCHNVTVTNSRAVNCWENGFNSMGNTFNTKFLGLTATGCSSGGIENGSTNGLTDSCATTGNKRFGISMSGTNPVVSNCVISDNTNGAELSNASNGIQMQGTNPKVSNCTINGNEGFGVTVYPGVTSPTIRGCDIRGNGTKGGVSSNVNVIGSVASKITDLTFEDNIVDQGAQTPTYLVNVNHVAGGRIRGNRFRGGVSISVLVQASVENVYVHGNDVDKSVNISTAAVNAHKFDNRGEDAFVTFGQAAPTSGTWPRGAVRFSVFAAAGGKVGWVCTAAGTPGTWKPFGAIDA